MYPTVIVNTTSVEALLMRARFALSTPGLMNWLAVSMADRLHDAARDRFAAQRGPDGQPWEPLAQATINIRAQQGYWPGLINWRTGEMERYITQVSAAVVGTPNGAMLTYPGRSPSGEMAEKIRVAQEGDPGGTDAPARPVLGFEVQDVAFALGSLQTYLITYISAGGSLS
jgi:phage gpG-like protein